MGILHMNQELAQYIHSFKFPSQAEIRRSKSHHYDIEGWVIDVNGGAFLYSDGKFRGRPRHAAYEAMNKPGGEDDFTCDEDWAEAERLQEHFTHAMIMDLDTAWKVISKSGYANRVTEKDEVVTEKQSGQKMTVVNNGTARGETGRYVKLADEQGQENWFPLEDLALEQASAETTTQG